MRDINEWPYSGEGSITDNWQNEVDAWTETNEENYWDQLECLPPRKMTGSVFAVGEPFSMTIHAVFAEIGGRFFGKNCDITKWNPVRYKLDIIKQFKV